MMLAQYYCPVGSSLPQCEGRSSYRHQCEQLVSTAAKSWSFYCTCCWYGMHDYRLSGKKQRSLTNLNISPSFNSSLLSWRGFRPIKLSNSSYPEMPRCHSTYQNCRLYIACKFIAQTIKTHVHINEFIGQQLVTTDQELSNGMYQTRV